MTLQEAINAKMWRTPQKVKGIILRDYYPDGSSKILYTCPRCDSVIRAFKRPCCEECGQALDWTDEGFNKYMEEHGYVK